MKLKPMIREKAKENKDSGLKQNFTVSQKSDERNIRTDEELAKTAGVSRDTIRKGVTNSNTLISY